MSETGIGWLSFSTDADKWDIWKEKIERMWDFTCNDRGKGAQGYAESWGGDWGIRAGITRATASVNEEDAVIVRGKALSGGGIRHNPNEGKMTWHIPQTALDVAGEEKLQTLVRDVHAAGARITRLDVYFDDYEKIIHPREVFRQLKAGEVSTPRVQSMRCWEENDLRACKSKEYRNAGFVAYLGHPKSYKMLRIYDKEVESKGERDCYRWEVQWRNKNATAVFNKLGNSTAPLGDTLKSLVKGAIAFKQPDNEELPDWWQTLLGEIQASTIAIPRRVPTLPKMMTWISTQVAPNLALIREVLEINGVSFDLWLQTELMAGKTRWKNDTHKRILSEVAFSKALPH